MLKITLINPPQYTKYPQPPMGIAQIAAVLEDGGYSTTIIDANALQITPGEVVPHLADPDVVGITAMTPTISSALEVAGAVKRSRPGIPVILGGAHATLLPEETLTASSDIDIVVRGEGEETILKLLPVLEDGQSLNGIQGISYRNGSDIINNPVRPGNVDPDSLPFFAYHLLPWKKYKPHPPHGRALPFAVTITSRGCPYQCAYCSKPVFGKKFRAQSPERVLRELTYFQEKLGIKEFAFYDDVFTLNRERAYNIADGIIKKGLRMHWTCETRVNLVDKELLLHMKRSGCYAIAYGVESASKEILDTICKDISLEQVEEAIRLTRETGIQTVGYFMLGSPGETPETIRQTIDFAKKLKLDFAQFSITTPFPGTQLYETYMADREDKKIPWESFVYAGTGEGVTPVFESARLSREEIQQWTKRAYREFYLRPSYVWQRACQIKSFGDLQMVSKGLTMLLGNLRKG